ncbi:cytochrome-c peroxidase [Persephonella atlantica]|uniref:Cytochrome-c peroxidase n=1 Tax=Persephonella atlantica TaxID=2699429 RepID=A0ABS1GH44_9AQUI|nr:cytochrome-c peroxidase [Persephonella atlantica]MBK3332175.1 cytochrome-c peroxidase [Persephonella atlantica]
MRILKFALLSVAVASVSAVASDTDLLNKAKNYFKPLPKEIPAPKDNPTTAEKVELGKKLYYDPRLSLSGVISCNTCHNLATFGVDNVPTALGHEFKTGGRNSPTVLNAGFHIAQFWDGRAKTLEDQAKGPILAHVEMAMPNPEFVVLKLKTIPGYVKEFKKVFGGNDPITYDNVAKAIAAFERTLVTPSRFDKFLKGDTNALTKKEKEGLRLFIDKGCASCHNGVAVGGEMFAKFGIVKPYPTPDMGKYKVTKKEEDKYVFKVPSLRNIAMTYPYFHDGSVWDLKEAVRIMGETQLGIKLSHDEIDKIVAFLKSLTGEIPESARTVPVLPASSKDTPKPKLKIHD